MEQPEIERFLADGFVVLRAAVAADAVEACTAQIWEAAGLSPDRPDQWHEPMVRVPGLTSEAIVAAMNNTALRDACEALCGPGRWAPRGEMGGFVLRFPTEIGVEVPDAGWHVEGSYMPEGASWWWTNVVSKDRAALALFLFSEVGEDDGPTRVRVGSHMDVPPVLAPYGVEGVESPAVDGASAHRPVASVTGEPGDVYLCHPFLVHAASPYHGGRPRVFGQPAVLAGPRPYRLDLAPEECSPIERSIVLALAGV